MTDSERRQERLAAARRERHEGLVDETANMLLALCKSLRMVQQGTDLQTQKLMREEEAARVSDERQLQQIVTRWEAADGKNFGLLAALLKRSGWRSPHDDSERNPASGSHQGSSHRG